MTERTPIAPTMQTCGVDGCGIPLGITTGCPMHGTKFHFSDGGKLSAGNCEPVMPIDGGTIVCGNFEVRHMDAKKMLATWHSCNCYVEVLGQSKRYYPCHQHEAAFDAILEAKA